MDAATVTRGEFIYRDTLFVDVGGEGKRHPRAAEAELGNLLNGKAQQKDQVAHWYEAQLVHYGLQRSRDKNTAKVRLQQALSQGKIKVPPHISDMEAQMKKEYAAAVRKAKKSADGDSTGAASTSASKKRKADDAPVEPSKRTKITVNVNGIAIDIEHDGAEPAKAKNPKKVPAAKPTIAVESDVSSKAAKRKPAAAAHDQSSKPSKVSSKSKVTEPSKSTPSAPSTKGKGVADSKVKTEPKSKAQPKAKAEPKAKPEPKVKPEPKAKAEPKVKPEAMVKAEPKVNAELKVKAEPRVKAEPKVKLEPSLSKVTPAKREPDVKAEPQNDPMDIDSFAQEAPGHRNVTGVYNIYSQQLAEQLPEEADKLRLFLCVDEGKIWGGFELGMKSGVLRADEIHIDHAVTFGWRARDSWEENKLKFGRGCFGEIVLYGKEQVRGTFYNLFNEPLVFDGQRRPGPLWCGRSPYSFEREWDGFVSEAYGRQASQNTE
ncbi:hypothetical protein LTR17_021462 [Elasticomyces elasticus]|nr:hypothetical protein LTR17_021462 [Elasticomyces elasticus]